MHQWEFSQIKIDNVAFERNHKSIFHSISCSLHSGEWLQITGANGSGKSTLLRMLAGLIEPQTGAILWQEQSIFEERERYQQQLQYLGHQNGIKHYLTIYENIYLSCALNTNKPHPQAILTTIETLGLTHLMHTQAQFLSAGQSRRLSLARVLLNPASLWILDEPTTALDVEGQALLTKVLDQHLEKGGIAIVATHQNLSLAKQGKTIHLEGQYG